MPYSRELRIIIGWQPVPARSGIPATHEAVTISNFGELGSIHWTTLSLYLDLHEDFVRIPAENRCDQNV